MHAHQTDGADFLGYDLIAETFVDLQGGVKPELSRSRVLAPHLDGFLARWADEGYSYFWVRRSDG